MNNRLKGKTVLVTGGTGSIGTEIVKQILNYDASKVIVFSRDEIKHFSLKKNLADHRLETAIGDIRDYRSIQRVFDDFDIDLIYHAAAMKHVVVCEKFPVEAARTNILGTQNIVDLATKYGTPKMISISTDKSAYPVNVMGSTKFIAERIALNANFSCVRFGNVANSHGSVIPILIENLLNGNPINITNPHATRFIMEIPDAVKLVMEATKYAQGGDLFILKMKAFKLGDLLDVILHKIAPRLDILEENVKVNIIGLVDGEKLHEGLINSTESEFLFELNNTYVVLKNREDALKYKNIKKINSFGYTSNEVDLISKSEIEKIIINYFKKDSMREKLWEYLTNYSKKYVVQHAKEIY